MTAHDGTVLERLNDEIANFIQEHHIHYERGEPRASFAKITPLSIGLTLPIVDQEHFITAVTIKNLYALWNIVVDDELDRHGTRVNLDASMQLLLSVTQKVTLVPPACDGVTVLSRLLSLCPRTDPRPWHRFVFDFWDIVNGFNYEYTINRSSEMANSIEYANYSTMTASIKYCLDVDYMFSSTSLAPESYRLLRKAYHLFSMAIKYASDIGTLQRELEDENNLNLVRILANEENPENNTRSSLDLQTSIRAVRNLAETNLRMGQTLLRKVPDVDIGLLERTVKTVVDVYLHGDPFFEKAT